MFWFWLFNNIINNAENDEQGIKYYIIPKELFFELCKKFYTQRQHKCGNYGNFCGRINDLNVFREGPATKDRHVTWYIPVEFFVTKEASKFSNKLEIKKD